jgi:medium-chain acyl-[acyl-carrier-protein] hydrolase
MSLRPVSPALWSFHPRSGGVAASDRPHRTFVLIPYAGGTAHSLAEWLPALLRAGDTAFLVQYPGRGPRADEPLPAALADLADEAAGELIRHSAGPLVLVGHSMGAVLAYETAHRLEAAGRRPDLVVVSASRPPHLIDIDAAELARRETDVWVRQMIADGFTEVDALPAPMVTAAVSVLRSDCLLVARHVASRGRLNCRVLALGGDADPDVSAGHLRGWAATTSAAADIRVLPGGHFFYRHRLGEIGEIVHHSLIEPRGRTPAARE